MTAANEEKEIDAPASHLVDARHALVPHFPEFWLGLVSLQPALYHVLVEGISHRPECDLVVGEVPVLGADVDGVQAVVRVLAVHDLEDLVRLVGKTVMGQLVFI